jgi:hypothetical protein
MALIVRYVHITLAYSAGERLRPGERVFAFLLWSTEPTPIVNAVSLYPFLG